MYQRHVNIHTSEVHCLKALGLSLDIILLKRRIDCCYLTISMRQILRKCTTYSMAVTYGMAYTAPHAPPRAHPQGLVV